MSYFTLPNILILFAVIFILFLLTEVKSYKASNKGIKKENLEKTDEEVFSNTLPEQKKIEITEIKYEELDKEEEKKKAQEELMNLRLKMMEEESLKEALKEIEKPVREEVSSPETISIPEVKTYKTIDEKDEEKLEQEEMDAIISINELETKGQKLYDSLEQEKIDEEEIPISIEELYETMELPTLNMKKLERIEEAKEEKKKEEKALYDLTETKEYPLVELEKDEVISKEQEKNKEILDEELKKTDEFLNFLKELKKNIE